MAAVRLIALHANKGRTIAQTLNDRTDYAKNPAKTEKGELVTAYCCDPITVDEEFMLQKRLYYQVIGRSRTDDVIAYQIRQSFKPGEITPEEANRLGHELALRFTKGKYSFIVATHTDRAHIHNHIVFNSTAMDGTKKFRDFRRSGLALQKVSDLICLENGLSVIAPAPYSERQKRTVYPKRESIRSIVCGDIDTILAGKPRDFEAFVRGLENAGYEVKRGRNLAAQRTEKRDALLSSIQISEKRLAEIAALKKHIINYSKTRSTYEAYRKAGYSKKFFEAHREELTLHKAAKQAFDELGVKKLPKVKELNAEYAELFAGKKVAYAEYRKLRDEAQEILIAQSNIGSIYDFAGGKLLRQEKEEQKR
jgi:hypothetical protein